MHGQPPQYGHFPPPRPSVPPQPPQYFGGVPQPPPPPPEKSGTGLILTISLVLGVVLIAGVLFVGLTIPVNGPAPKPKAEPSLRPNQPVLELVPGSGPAPRYGGTPMFDACNLIPLNELSNYGLSHDVTQNMVHNYIDGDVPAGPAITQGYTDSPSMCMYPLAGESGDRMPSLSASVRQTPFNEPGDVASSLETTSSSVVQHTADHRGIHIVIYHRDDAPESLEANIGRSDVVVELSYEPPLGAPDVNKLETMQRLTTSIADKILVGPTGPAKPKWTGRYAHAPNPCEVVTPESFRAAYGKPATTYVEASYQFSDAQFREDNPPSYSYRVEMKCRRSALVAGGKFGEGYDSAEASIAYWQDETGARNRQIAECRDTVLGVEPQPVNVSVGDGPTCSQQLNTSYDLLFKSGRSTVRLAPYHQIGTPEEAAQLLGPLGQQIAGNLR